MKVLIYTLLAAVGLFVLVGAFAPNSPEDKERRGHQLAIERCWEQQARKSLAPAEARFVAAACEKMEADFKSRYKRAP